MKFLNTFFTVVCAAAWVVSEAAQAAAAVNVVSGISASEEYCLSAGGGIGVDGAALLLDNCAEAVALGDGRELFSLQGDGQLLSVPGGLCASVGENDLAEGAAVSFAKCDGGSRWEIQGNGQLKLNSAGDFCLTQEGAAPGLRDVAANAAAMASSTGNAFSHGAALALDGQPNTFWASKFDDVAQPVEFLVDLGDNKRLQSMAIFWEFPARAFSVALSSDGEHFREVFATDANVLSMSRVALGGGVARKVRIVMKEPHPTHASFQGHSLYGIRHISVHANDMRAVISGCAKAAKSSDARDKYFLASVRESDSSSAKAFQSEIPSLEAAQAALAATISQLVDALPKLGSCGGVALPRQRVVQGSAQLSKKSTAHVGDSTQVAGPEQEDLNLLLKEARKAVISMRSALA